MESLAPDEAVAFEGPDFRKEIGRWRLSANQDSLQIPHLGSAGSGRLGSLLLGRALGAALFPKAFFSGDDSSCHPDLGSDRFPGLLWRGATAQFEPDPERATPAATAHSVERSDARSLILFRRNLGPPPGILLLSRLKTLGSGCPKAYHRTYYQRLFLPRDDLRAAGRCIDLAILDPRPNPLRAERLVFLQPGHLAQELARPQAPYDVILYAEPACQGPSLVLSSTERRADRHLEDHRFRRQLKSLRFQPQTALQSSPAAFRSDSLPAESAAAPATDLSGAPSLAKAVEQQFQGSFLNDPAIRPAGPSRGQRPTGQRRFAYPILGSNRLGFCLADGHTCGEAVAQDWCRAAGFSAALSWTEDPGSALDFPTLSLDRQHLCSSRDCSGFREIVCGG